MPALLTRASMTLGLLAACVAPASADATEAPFVIYVAPNASTSNDGLTRATALPTLELAEAKVAAKLEEATLTSDVEIRILPGTYAAPTTVWNTYVPGHTISFMHADYNYSGSAPAAALPVFQPSGPAQGYWFWAASPTEGLDTQLRFYYLKVSGYANGLGIIGKTRVDGATNLRRPDGVGLNKNVLYGMVFQSLGSKYNKTAAGFGGLVMWNSSGNSIRNNHFVNLENDDSPAAIHGIYAAHGSSNNLIEVNSFRYISGAPVNFRNDANSTIINKNTFTRTGATGTAYYSDWSCGTSCVSDGLAKVPPEYRNLECPSHGNSFTYNTLNSGYTDAYLPAFIRRPGGPEDIGPEGCGSDGQVWLTTSGNIRN